MKQSLFIGYCSLEEWAQVVDRSRPVMVIAFGKDEPMSKQFAGPGVCTLGVEVGQHDADGIVHYCRITAAKFQTIFGEVSGEEAQRIQRAGIEHQNQILDWLKAQGFTLRTGNYSRAVDWTSTIGHADVVARFDKEQKRYLRTP